MYGKYVTFSTASSYHWWDSLNNVKKTQKRFLHQEWFCKCLLKSDVQYIQKEQITEAFDAILCFPRKIRLTYTMRSTFRMRYGMKEDASFSVRWYSSWLSKLKSNLRYSSAFIRTLVLVSKNRRVSHFKIRSRQLMTPSFSLSKCLKWQEKKKRRSCKV